MLRVLTAPTMPHMVWGPGLGQGRMLGQLRSVAFFIALRNRFVIEITATVIAMESIR
jgi:hypothetical protein